MKIQYVHGEPARLWRDRVLPVYLIWGGEDWLKDEVVASLAAHLVPSEFADFDSETLHAADLDSETILAACSQAPLGAMRRLVVARGVEAWSAASRHAAADRLADGLSRLPATGCLVLVAAAREDSAGRRAVVTAKLDEAVDAAGAMVECRALRDEALAHWLEENVAQRGTRLHPAAAARLIDMVGSDLRRLTHEIDKLIAYSAGQPAISAADVDEVTTAAPDDVAFRVVDAVASGETDRALALLAEAHRYHPHPQAVAGRLLALLARHYRLLWQMRYLLDNRVRPADIPNLPAHLRDELPEEPAFPRYPRRVADLARQAQSQSWLKLRKAFELLLQCDLANKGARTGDAGAFGGDPAVNLQLLVLALTARS